MHISPPLYSKNDLVYLAFGPLYFQTYGPVIFISYPMILYYAQEGEENMEMLTTAEEILLDLRRIDKDGSIFRYPTTYSFEYKYDNESFNARSQYEYYMGLAEFLDNCGEMLRAAEEYENEYEYDIFSL